MYIKKRPSGQIMLLSVVMLGGILLSATAVAGLLMQYQIRQTNDAVNSAKALFAADGTLEWESYCMRLSKFSLLAIPAATLPNYFPPNPPECAGLPAPEFLGVLTGTTIIVSDNPVTGKRETRITAEANSMNAIRAVETILPV